MSKLVSKLEILREVNLLKILLVVKVLELQQEVWVVECLKCQVACPIYPEVLVE
jgi:hypothetical protein